MDIVSGISKTSAKSISSGVIGALGSRYILGVSGQVPIMGMNVDSMVMYGLVVGGASAINEATKDFTLPLLGLDRGIVSTGQMIAGPALTGAATIAIASVVNGFEIPPWDGSKNAFLLGAVSDIAGSYTANMISY